MGTEHGRYKFVVKEGETGSKLSIAAEPVGEVIEKLGFPSFNLEPGILMSEAAEIARKLNYWITTTSATSF
jgi:hypothetical protein